MPTLRPVVLAAATLTAVAHGAFAQAPHASGGELRDDQACFDVLHYDLALRVDPNDESIRGSLEMQARVTAATRRIALDLDSLLEVTSVELDGMATEFEFSDGRIAIPLRRDKEPGSTLRVRIAYGGKPRVAPNPPWRGGFTWAKTADGTPWIATTCQGEGADLWWPCKDHPSDEPSTMDLRIEVPDGLVVASNGTLQSAESTEDGWRRFHWHIANPINNYCVAINIGPYIVVESEFASCSDVKVPVVFYALPESEKKAREALPEFLDHLAHMEEVCGPYPFRNEKYGVVQTPHLGMEHQTMIAYGYDFQKKPPGYDWLHHHELSHEWWANLVTCRDWKDMWIHEGIGTYMQPLYVESRFGKDAMHATLREQRRMIMNRKAIAPREPHDSRKIYFSTSGNDIYYKGSWVVHSLRYLLGDDAFFRALRRMAYPDPELEKKTDGSQTRFTDTEEIRAIAERESGVELEWFFEVYVRRAGLPRLHADLTDDGKRLDLRWSTPDDLPFPMPVPVAVDGEVVRVEMQDGEGSVDVGDGPFEVDPDAWLLKRGGEKKRS